MRGNTGDDERGYIDPGDLRGDVFLAGGEWPRGFRGGRSAQAIGDHRFQIIWTERIASQDMADGRDDAVAAVVSADHSAPHVERQSHRRGRRRGDQDQPRQPGWATRREQLRHLAAHRMPDQNVAIETEAPNQPLSVVGQIRQRITLGGFVRPAATSLIYRDSTKNGGESVGDMAPGARRPAPIVQEDERRGTRS